MKRILTILLSLGPLFAVAQEPYIIGGYLLDGKDSFEELDAAVLTESKDKDRMLDGKGMKFPGGIMVMTQESVGMELGSVVKTKRQFLIKTISFNVEENSMEGCRADIRIYRMHEDGNLENIVTMPICQEIPKTDSKTTFSIGPEENLELTPGEYYISFSLSGTPHETNGKMHFPLYVKSSYSRKDSGSQLEKWNFNIGMTINGSVLD